MADCEPFVFEPTKIEIELPTIELELPEIEVDLFEIDFDFTSGISAG